MNLLLVIAFSILSFAIILLAGYYGNHISEKQNIQYAGPIFATAAAGMIIFGAILYFAFRV